MMFMIFAMLSMIPNGINCNNTNSFTVLSDNKTEMSAIFKSIVLNCPILYNESNLSVIIWKFDDVTIPLPINFPVSTDITTRIRGGGNGSLLIDKLQYDDAKVYKCSGYGTDLLFEVYINLIVNGPPQNFDNFSYEALSESAIKFSWKINITNTNSVQMYNITLCKSLITNECLTESFTHPSYSFTFKNLNAFSEYHASIIAINSVGVNKRADLKARTGPGWPLARPYLVLMQANERNVTLRIDCQLCAIKEKMLGYLKYFLIKYDEVTLKHFTNKSSIETTIVSLHPYRNYTFFVSASNGHKSGPEDSIRCLTKEDYPESTSYLRPIDMTSHHIIVKWESVSDRNGPILGYILKVTNNNLPIRIEDTIEVNRTVDHYRLKNLKPRNTYSIKLAAKNSVGISKFSETMAQTDRAVPLPPRINQVKIIHNFVRIAWKNLLPKNETAILIYDICLAPSSHIDFERKCFQISSSGDSFLKCICKPNSTIHSVDIPTNRINLNYSKIIFWVKVKVQSDLCQDNRNCRYLEAISEEHALLVNGAIMYSEINPRSFFTHTIIILLIVGCAIFFAGFFVLFCFCGNANFKQLFSPNRAITHYTRPTGEYIEVFPRQVSQPKIIPLEKTPYPAIQVKDLVDHIMDYRCDDGAGFQTEFENIELMDTSRWSITYPNLKDNKAKNRYTNIFPYDHSRVTLQNPPNGKSDYINASFIDGYNRRNAYIATQGPLPETITDFWEMVYEQNSDIIVMISNFDERGRRKCEMYWVPNKMTTYGYITVRQIYHKKMAFYTERRFAIKNIRNKKTANKERLVYHYQYTDWRDFDVPPSSLPVLVFVKATTKHWTANSGPIIVHCSAGVGRTGTYICIESQIRQMEQEHKINVRGFLEHIRQQRMKLVQTESQYTFIHDALYEYYLCPDHEISKEFFSAYIFQLKLTDPVGFSKLEEQFQMCTQFEPTNYEYIECKRSYNVSKNRSKILPIESRRINLSCEPGIDGSNYINASAIQGYWEMKEFIITQHPLEDTEPDLWKMVWDENCNIVILLSSDNMPQFWPAFENDFRTYCWSRVNFCNIEEKENTSQHGFLLSSPREDYALDCTMHRLKRWPTSVSDTEDLLRLLFKINSERAHSPIVVIDDFGGSKAGIFVALSSLINQLRNDEVVDVYFVMKMIHMERPHTFSSSEDLRFVYELIELVIANQNQYSFFTSPTSDFIPNGVCHQKLPNNNNTSNLNNTSFISQYATLNTLRSNKSSTSMSRRRASSAESEPFYVVSSPSPVTKSRGPHNRISWNPGESTRYSAATDSSTVDWSTNSIGNGHYNGVVSVLHHHPQQQQPSLPHNNNGTVIQIISNPVSSGADLPVLAKQSSNQCTQNYNNSLSSLGDPSAMDNNTSIEIVC